MTMNASKGLVNLVVAALLIGGGNSYQFPSNAKKSPVGVNNNQPSNIASSQKDLSDGSSPSDAADNTISMRLSRRNLLRAAAALSVGTLTAQTATPMKEAAAAEGSGDDVATPLYFGVGCFWHIQHEFIEGETTILGRDPHQFTAAAGYAGGKSTDKEGRVCYHNFQSIADYGKLGHGEVVGMTIPQSKIGDFCELYFSLFNPKTKDRVDPMDRGGEYRSLIGLPGGTKHVSYPLVQAAAEKAGFQLAEGKGNDGDTLGKQLVYVYDSTKFPFYQAEVYHQYHNDFQSKPYGKAYNDMVNLALEDGRIKGTGCPDRI